MGILNGNHVWDYKSENNNGKYITVHDSVFVFRL